MQSSEGVRLRSKLAQAASHAAGKAAQPGNIGAPSCRNHSLQTGLAGRRDLRGLMQQTDSSSGLPSLQNTLTSTSTVQWTALAMEPVRDQRGQLQQLLSAAVGLCSLQSSDDQVCTAASCLT